MRFIVQSAFRNSNELEVLNQDGTKADAVNEKHVHKGAFISIGVDRDGRDLPLEKMAEKDRRLIAELNLARRIVEASNTEAVKVILAEVAAEKREAEAQAQASKMASANQSQLSQALTAALAKAAK